MERLGVELGGEVLRLALTLTFTPTPARTLTLPQAHLGVELGGEVLRDGLGRGGEDAQVEEDLPGSGAGNE